MSIYNPQMESAHEMQLLSVQSARDREVHDLKQQLSKLEGATEQQTVRSAEELENLRAECMRLEGRLSAANDTVKQLRAQTQAQEGTTKRHTTPPRTF